MILQLLTEKSTYTGEKFIADLGTLVIWIVSIAGALMTLYAVYIGYLFATASDETKRKAAKERLIKTIASSLIVIALASILSVIKVTFDTVEGRVDEIDVFVGQYTYSGQPGISFSGVKYIASKNVYGSDGSITLDPKNILANGKKLVSDSSQIIFTECEITSPSWPWHTVARNTRKSAGAHNFTFSVEAAGNSGKDIEIPYILQQSKTGQKPREVIMIKVSFVLVGKEEQIETFEIAVDVNKNNTGITYKQVKTVVV